jgi:hypothetical protein
MIQEKQDKKEVTWAGVPTGTIIQMMMNDSLEEIAKELQIREEKE